MGGNNEKSSRAPRGARGLKSDEIADYIYLREVVPLAGHVD